MQKITDMDTYEPLRRSSGGESLRPGRHQTLRIGSSETAVSGDSTARSARAKLDPQDSSVSRYLDRINR